MRVWQPAFTDNEREILRRFAATLHSRQLDETPVGMTMEERLRDAGYRGGWNDATRSIIRELEGR